MLTSISAIVAKVGSKDAGGFWEKERKVVR